MKKIILVIGIIAFIVILTATSMLVNTKNTNDNNINQESNTQNEYVENLEYKGSLPLPLENFTTITSRFGSRWGKMHTGIDLVGNKGCRILAAADGKVILKKELNVSYGNYVKIEHTMSNGTKFITLYAHMQQGSITVTENQTVKAGQVLGIQRLNTGILLGDHLHFEIIINGKQVDPYNYLFNDM